MKDVNDGYCVDLFWEFFCGLNRSSENPSDGRFGYECKFRNSSVGTIKLN